jgi:hypothetical protein
MSKHMIKALGMLLAVCFLMSVTAAAVSAEAADNAYSSQKSAKDISVEKLISEKGLKKENIIINILIILKNIFVFKGRGTHPLLRAAALKKAKEGLNEG